MRLIFVGGVQGVCKSTLLSWLMNEFNVKIRFVDPGELFRTYCVHEKLKTYEEVEDLIVQSILAMPGDSTVVVHWHYAVVKPEGYIPQVSFERIEKLAKSGLIHDVKLVSIEASIDVILGRRLNDSGKKKRNLRKDGIALEIARDLEFMERHRDIFEAYLGPSHVSSHRIENVDLESTKLRLWGIV